MASQMMDALMALCQERHIDELYLLDRLEQSLAKSYADVLHLQHGAKVTIDRATGKVYVYKLVPVGEPDEETGEYAEYREVDVTPKNTSRIAAQQAKIEIKAIVRNAARQQIYEEFSDRVGDIITGTVLQSTPDFEIVKIREGVEAELPHFDQRRFPEERNERPAGERYSHNQRLKALIIDVRDPNSTQQPVRGERVDVVLWSDDPARCVANALSPAKVSRVIVDDENKYATVIVPDDQLSLAIGKEGQNARLAARLTGYHIDIKNESLARDILRDIPSIVSDEVDEVETDGRCEYLFPDGRRCRNSARPGSRFCGVHERLDALAGEDVRVSDDPDSLI